MEKEEINFGSSVDELLKGLEGFVSSKTVVGEPIQVNDATIIPLVDMKFGMGAGAFKKNSDNKTAGGIGANISPCAVLIIQKGMAKVVNIKNQEIGRAHV